MAETMSLKEPKSQKVASTILSSLFLITFIMCLGSILYWFHKRDILLGQFETISRIGGRPLLDTAFDKNGVQVPPQKSHFENANRFRRELLFPFRKIVHVDFRGSAVKDSDLPILEDIRTLISADVSETEISIAGLQALSNHPQIEKVTVSLGKLEKISIEKIRIERPKLKIEIENEEFFELLMKINEIGDAWHDIPDNTRE